MRRTAIGIVAVLLVIGGLGLYVAGSVVAGSSVGGILARAGLVLGALWLVEPAVRRLSPAVLVTMGVVALAVVLRPRLVLIALVLAVPLAVLVRLRWGKSDRR